MYACYIMCEHISDHIQVKPQIIYIMCEHISDHIQVKPQIIVVEDSGKQEQEMRDVVWRRA